MTKSELDQIRAQIANEPSDSISQRLLAEIDRLQSEQDEISRAMLINQLRATEYLTPEEAARYVDTTKELQMEIGPCRKCSGKGRSYSSGCFGTTWTKCTHCFGRGQSLRVRLPWLPCGELVVDATKAIRDLQRVGRS